MHDDRVTVERRLRRVLRERVEPAVYGDAVPLRIGRWDARALGTPPAGEPGAPKVAEGLAAAYEDCPADAAWGPAWGTTWFRVRGEVPAGWAGRAVEARIDLGFDPNLPGFQCEGLVYHSDGTPVKGLNPRTPWVRVTDHARGGELTELYVEAAANPVLIAHSPTHQGDRLTSDSTPQYRLARMELAVFEREVWELAQDLGVLGQLMEQLSTDDARRFDLLRAIERCLDALDLADVAGTAGRARAELAPALASPAHASAHRISAVGHAHIDTAWLWPQRETVRKVARTCANVVELMDTHPDFVFAMSQAQQLAWLKEHRPEVFARVRERIRTGSFVPVGGMWVESDTNMVGGEAMARQLVHGKRFFLQEFGVETQEVWLPDSFGYTAALPQLVKLAGNRWFLTQKISWNQSNRFPHHTFWWEGIDGTRIFTHFPPVDTYNSDLSGGQLAHAARNYREKGCGSRSLVPFGWGDGGGGPTREMLARAQRLRDLEGSPRVVLEPPAAFFAAAEAEYPDAPVWVGELYLELHRGTYTSQAGTKQGNRRSESLLHEAELWSTTAALRVPGFAYPHAELERLWKTVLLHQFHDILPGSSIAWVHREARDTYALVHAELETLVGSAQTALAGPSGAAGTLLFNGAPHAREGVPAGGAGVLPEAGPSVALARADGGGHILDNGLLRVVVDARGLVVSVLDRTTDRETLAPASAADLLQLHPDHPTHWDAWDIDEFYRHRVTDLVALDSLDARLGGDGEARVTVTRRFGASRVRQTTSLRPGARQVDFETEIDWHESEHLLKAAFPLDVKADQSEAETQFGHVARPTHRNTSWDAARFEICAHRWIRVAEPGASGFGVAIANDSTYGHDVTRDVRPDGGQTTTVRLSLLRAPRYPDPETDQGTHLLRYSLVPGATTADAVRAGHALNLPGRRVRGTRPVGPLVAVEGEAVVLETLKLADDRSGDVVVRLYECLGGRARTVLRPGFPLARVTETDLLERPLAEAPTRTPAPDGSVPLRLRPFQILTLRLTPDLPPRPT